MVDGDSATAPSIYEFKIHYKRDLNILKTPW